MTPRPRKPPALLEDGQMVDCDRRTLRRRRTGLPAMKRDDIAAAALVALIIAAMAATP